MFRYVAKERFKVDRRFGEPIDNAEESLNLNAIEEEILVLIALRKYMTIQQILDMECLNGSCLKEVALNDILFGLEKRRVLTRYKMFIPNVSDGIVFYGLNFWGSVKVRQEMGIQLHKGICWYPPKDRQMRGIPKEIASDVKRILMGNQILVEFEKAGVPMKKAGVMETFRTLKKDKPDLFRSTVNIEMDDNLILAFDVVRTYSTAYMEVVSKMERYYRLLKDKDYLAHNYHNHKTFPQVVFVVEDEEHAKKLKRYMQERGVWNLEDVTVLFTEDALVMSNVTKSIYELDENDEKIWYELPVYEELEMKVAEQYEKLGNYDKAYENVKKFMNSLKGMVIG